MISNAKNDLINHWEVNEDVGATPTQSTNIKEIYALE
jgi:hypothetical protein